MSKEEAKLKKQYEASVKDPNGKELMFLLDVLVKEISYRNEHNMFSIELQTIDVAQCVALLEQLKALIPEEMGAKGMKLHNQQFSLEAPDIAKKQSLASVASTSANMESSADPENGA